MKKRAGSARGKKVAAKNEKTIAAKKRAESAANDNEELETHIYMALMEQVEAGPVDVTRAVKVHGHDSVEVREAWAEWKRIQKEFARLSKKRGVND